jgi:hypothetical protein
MSRRSELRLGCLSATVYSRHRNLSAHRLDWTIGPPATASIVPRKARRWGGTPPGTEVGPERGKAKIWSSFC